MSDANKPTLKGKVTRVAGAFCALLLSGYVGWVARGVYETLRRFH